MRIDELIGEIGSAANLSLSQIAERLDVSTSSVSRWASGETLPHPDSESALRRLHQELCPSLVREAVANQYSIWGDSKPQVADPLVDTLSELRELFHRLGRLSGRNEAVEEVAKLVYCHAIGITNGHGGITYQTVGLSQEVSDESARALKQYVSSTLQESLPRSLAHTTSPNDFVLRIRDSENHLAHEVVGLFDSLEPVFKEYLSDHKSGSDLLNEVFGRFLSSAFSEEKEMGQYLTPPEVVDYMVQLALHSLPEGELQTLLDPASVSSFGLIMDPSCGVGSFLAGLVSTLHPRIVRERGSESAETWLKDLVTRCLVGIDKSERMIRLALTNLALFGFPGARLHLADALSLVGQEGQLSKSLEGKAGLILTNPPFGAEIPLEEAGVGSLKGYLDSASLSVLNSELVFLDRYLRWLRPWGHLLTVIPDSILTHKGVYQAFRRQIPEQAQILSVTSLPSETFTAAGTQTKTSILHLVKGKHNQLNRSGTFVAFCGDIGFSVTTKNAQRSKSSNGDGDLPQLLEAFIRHKDTQHARSVESLEVQPRWDAIYHASMPLEVEQALESLGQSATCVRDVANLINDRDNPKRWSSEFFNYIEISDIDDRSLYAGSKKVSCKAAPSRARKVVKEGDVLVSTVRPDRRTIGVVGPDNDGAVCTTGFAVLRSSAMDPLVFALLLKTDFATAQITRNLVGIAYPAIEEGCLLEVVLPLSKDIPEALKGLTQEIRKLHSQLEQKRRRLVESVTELSNRWSLSEVTANPRLPE